MTYSRELTRRRVRSISAAVNEIYAPVLQVPSAKKCFRERIEHVIKLPAVVIP